MRIHILGICGTFMGSLAVLAKALGHEVSGSDQAVYPPMSTQLEAQGITLASGYDAKHLSPRPDVVIVGNAMSRGNPMVEAMLDQKIPYISGPQWLKEQLLCDRHVIAVAGTHGKTTVTSMIAWILEHAGLAPGFLIGGVAKNFEVSARLGETPYFVIEADEYDTAFYDKRSKFLHYSPTTLVMNNLEFDHHDIFDDLEAIKKQFQFLLRTVPSGGQVIYPQADENLTDVIQRGCWSSLVTLGGDWMAQALSKDGSEIEIFYHKQSQGILNWTILGEHNVQNALAAIIAANQVGVSAEQAIAALTLFKGIKRRMEVRGVVDGITVYDDFAHHPTAIATTIAGLRAKVGDARIISVLEFGSSTMKEGVYQNLLPRALEKSDAVVLLNDENINWDIKQLATQIKPNAQVFSSVGDIVNELPSQLKSGDHVLIMSNKGFGGIHEKLLAGLGLNQQ